VRLRRGSVFDGVEVAARAVLPGELRACARDDVKNKDYLANRQRAELHAKCARARARYAFRFA